MSGQVRSGGHDGSGRPLSQVLKLAWTVVITEVRSSQVKSSGLHAVLLFVLQAMLSAKPWVRGETVASL